MKPLMLSMLLLLPISFGCTSENQQCNSDPESFSELGSGISQFMRGNDDSVTKAYRKFIDSGIIEYESERPVIYSITDSLETFFKRTCHDEMCDIGDVIGVIDICINSTKEGCALIAATRGKDLYCLLYPSFRPDFSKPYNPLK